jgi:hypothetical protein
MPSTSESQSKSCGNETSISRCLIKIRTKATHLNMMISNVAEPVEPGLWFCLRGQGDGLASVTFVSNNRLSPLTRALKPDGVVF